MFHIVYGKDRFARLPAGLSLPHITLPGKQITWLWSKDILVRMSLVGA
jgi:hypothetical protein